MNKHNERVYLREWRLAKGLTQPELAKRIGTVKSEISRLESGSRRMTIDWLNSISRALGVSPEDLLSLPPMGFGAVSPAPRMPGQTDGQQVRVGDIEITIEGLGREATTVTGDDWLGTFASGDVLIYDTSKKATTVPGIYALEVGGETITRRVTPGVKGQVLSCSNEAYPPSPLTKDFTVLGRVVARVHRL